MDLTERVKSFRSRQRQVLSWILTAGRPPRVVVAMGDRLTLLLIGQVLARPEHLLAAVTSEREAMNWVANKQPTLLICAAPLEEGSCLSLCRSARKLCPEIQILALLTEQPGRARELETEWKGMNTLVDVAVSTADLGDSDYPLMRAFMELARQRTYRSASLRQSTAAGTDSQAQLRPQLSPREEHVLDLLSQGLRDREIAAALGVTHHTARSYVRDVRRKLGAGNRVSAAVWRWSQAPKGTTASEPERERGEGEQQ
jgi:DNA-binding NarL/FixJ family response regulator